MTDTGAHLPYADNCVALALSKALSKPQAQVVRECIETYDCIKTWRDLEEDTNLKAVFGDVKHWTPVVAGGGTWNTIKQKCLAGAQGKLRWFAIHWGAYTSEQWGKPKLTFHAICIQVKGGRLAVFGNNEEPQTRRDPQSASSSYKQTGTQDFARSIKSTDWISAWSSVK